MHIVTKLFLDGTGLMAGSLALLAWRTRQQKCKPHWYTHLSMDAHTVLQRAQQRLRERLRVQG